MKVGEVVFGLTDPTVPVRGGTEAESVIARSLKQAPKPHSLDQVFASGVPIGGLTAWQVLYDHAHLSGQDTILIYGAAGGVGSFAVQFAISTHAYVIAIASSEKVEFLTDLATHKIIDYKKLNFEDLVHNVDPPMLVIGYSAGNVET